jgi:hypothetical protein
LSACDLRTRCSPADLRPVGSAGLRRIPSWTRSSADLASDPGRWPVLRPERERGIAPRRCSGMPARALNC